MLLMGISRSSRAFWRIGRAADATLKKLWLHLRLAHQWRWLSHGQYEHVSRIVAEIGKLLRGRIPPSLIIAAAESPPGRLRRGGPANQPDRASLWYAPGAPVGKDNSRADRTRPRHPTALRRNAPTMIAAPCRHRGRAEGGCGKNIPPGTRYCCSGCSDDSRCGKPRARCPDCCSRSPRATPEARFRAAPSVSRRSYLTRSWSEEAKKNFVTALARGQQWPDIQ